MHYFITLPFKLKKLYKKEDTFFNNFQMYLLIEDLFFKKTNLYYFWLKSLIQTN